jgi:hypothetical protein
MPPTLFFSYSHVDESLRDQLEVHLSALKRQGLIAAFHDRRITAGSDLGKSIDTDLNSAEVILLLVSPDFIASDFCYDREMMRAMERHETGEARVIPVILRPCDWHDLPFGKLLGVPRDGKAITTWTNADEAFQDVVRSIKGALQELGQRKTSAAAGKQTKPVWAEAVESTLAGPPRSSNLRIKKQFSDYDLDQFRHEGFEFIAKYFRNSLEELVARNPALNQVFRRIDTDHFSAAVYRNGDKVCMGSAALSGGAMHGSSAIEYSMTDAPRSGAMNEAVYAKADDQKMYFEALGMKSYGRDKEKLTPEGAAELFWELFIQPLQR